MSQLRIAHPGLPTEVVVLGPAYARRAGFGGAAIGHYQTTFTVKRAAPGTVDPAAAAGHRSASEQRAVERKRAYRAAEARRRSS